MPPPLRSSRHRRRICLAQDQESTGPKIGRQFNRQTKSRAISYPAFDPYPFREKDLDKDAEAFIVDWARELPRDHALRIVVHLPGAEAAREGPDAVRRYFAHRETVFGAGPFARVVEESLIILGWVANWRPLEIFLHEWWPIVRRRNLYRRLADAQVTINAV